MNLRVILFINIFENQTTRRLVNTDDTRDYFKSEKCPVFQKVTQNSFSEISIKLI
jgi:hypothetical protein